MSNDFIISTSKDKTIRIWNISNGKCIRKFEELNVICTCCCFHPINSNFFFVLFYFFFILI